MSGSRNVTTLSLEQHLQQSLKRLESEFLQFKNRQPVGGDVLIVQGYPDNNQVQLIGPLTLGAYGSSSPFFIGTFIYNVSPANQTLTLWNFSSTLYVDPTINPVSGLPDAAHQIGASSGSTLTTAQKSCTFDPWLDWADSSDTTNARSHKARVVNLDASSHTYYVVIRAYFPNLNQ